MGPGTQDFWWNSRPETLDQSCGWDRRPETQDPTGGTWDSKPATQLIGGTWDPRPGTLMVAPKTRGTYFTWDLRPKAQDTEKGIWDTYDRWDSKPKTNISCQTWDARTMIQINLTKCPIRRDQVYLLVYRPDRSYLKQNQKNNITKFSPTGFFLNLLFLFFEKKKKKKKHNKTYINN